MNFTPRVFAPADDNLYYINNSYGGYNKCIVIDNETGSVLPNCTGYAWGRFCECQDNVHNCNLSRGNADLWYNNFSDGYERGQLPKLGAVICFSGGTSGHVAIVEAIDTTDGSILISNSAYNGRRFFTLSLSYPYSYGSNYEFQGFIYNPTNFDNNPIIQTNKRKKFPFVLYSKKTNKLIK